MFSIGLFLSAASVCLMADEDRPVEKAEFQQILARLHAEIRDASFIFEGEDRAPDSLPPEVRERVNLLFQGNYSYRSDGACFQETFRRRKSGASQVRTLESFLNWREQQATVPNRRTGRRSVDSQPGVPGLLRPFVSPSQILAPALMKQLSASGDFQYKFLGWEEVEGHRCLKVLIDESPRNPSANHAISRYWFDLARGGHILRKQIGRGSAGSKEYDQIRVERFEVDGKTLWFPVSARIREFSFAGRTMTDPFITETIYIVNGTLKLNEGLGDEAFDLKRRLGLPEHTSLRGLRVKYDGTPKPRSSLAEDPKVLKKRLDDAITSAEEQKTIIDASAAATTEASGAFWKEALLVGGIVATVAVAFLVWKARGVS